QEHVPLPEKGPIRGPILLTLPIPRKVVAETRQQSAAHRLGELVVLGAPEFGEPLPLGLRIARPRDGGQQVVIEAMMGAQVSEALWLDHVDLYPSTPETCHDLLLRCEDFRVNRNPVDGRHDGDAKVAQVLMTRRGYDEAPGRFLAALRTSEDVKRQFKILGAARQRSLHAHDGQWIRDGRKRELTATWQRAITRAMAVYATEGGRDANRATDIAADFEGREPGSQGGGSAAGAAP